MRAKNENPDAPLRITDQYHSKGGMAYDLKCRGVRLSLLVTERARPDDPGDWRVEARSARSDGVVVTVMEWGATRRDALADVAHAWVRVGSAPGTPMFDWDAVANLLSSVRAL